MIRNPRKLMNMLFESEENPMITTEEDRFHLEDCIQYVTKPGVIVATIKGKSKYGIQQLPIGAIDNFRFMKITNEEAILEQEKNNGKSYEQVMDEYEGEKGKILEQWKQNNEQTYGRLLEKYGDRLVGMDIIQNEKKFQPKQDDEDTDNSQENDSEDNNKDDGIVTEDDNMKNDQELKDATKDVAQFMKDNEDKMFDFTSGFFDKISKKSANKKFFDRLEEIKQKSENMEGKQKQKFVDQEIFKMQKEGIIPKEVQEIDGDDFKKAGFKDTDKFEDAQNTLQQKKNEYEGTTEQGEKKQLNESILGLLFSGVMGIFNLAWGALSLLWAYPGAAFTLCIFSYLMGKRKK